MEITSERHLGSPLYLKVSCKSNLSKLFKHCKNTIVVSVSGFSLVCKRCVISSSLWISVYFDCMWTVPNSDIFNVSINVLQFFGREGGLLPHSCGWTPSNCFVNPLNPFHKSLELHNEGCTEVDFLYSSSASTFQYYFQSWQILVATWPPPPPPPTITVYKIDSFSTLGSSAQTVNPWTTAVTPEIMSLRSSWSDWRATTF